MQIKTILRSLLLAYALSGICLLLLALMVFKLDIGQGTVTVGILVIYVVSCLAGGFLSGKLMRQNKYKWGFLVGLCYFVLLMVVSFIVQRRWDMSTQHAITTRFYVCLGRWAACSREKNFYLGQFYAILSQIIIHKEGYIMEHIKH